MALNGDHDPAQYGPHTIEVLEGLEAVRRRPGMYVGDLHDGTGLHHMIWEVVGNTLDQHLARRATRLDVELVGERVTITDDGPGIPVREHRGLSLLEVIFTKLHAGATFDGHSPHIHVGHDLHGVGLGPICALSARLDVETHRDGRVWRAAFERGRVVGPPRDHGPSGRTGTRIGLVPDPTVFTCRFDPARVEARLRELAYLFPLLTIRWNGVTLPGRGGPPEWVRALADGPIDGDTIVATRRTIDDVVVDLALAWSGRGVRRIESFVNGSRTLSGTHEQGLDVGLVEAARARGCTADSRVVRELLRPGLVAVVHVGLLDPRWRSPTRDHLCSPEARDAVGRAVAARFATVWKGSPLDVFLHERLHV